MKIESLLPLGKLDPGLREPDTPLDVRDFARLSKVAEDVGLDAVLVEELDETRRLQIFKEISTLLSSGDAPNLVHYHGARSYEGAIQIAMDVCPGSLLPYRLRPIHRHISCRSAWA